MADVAASLKDWSTTEASNSPADATTLGAGLADNLQQIQATVRDVYSRDSISSATTTDIGAKDAGSISVNLVASPITGFGTVSAGIRKWLTFTGIISITHNATSMILPGAADITTANGDTACFESLGSGNWRCLVYNRANGLTTVANTTFADGSVSAPGIGFTSDTNTGLYRIGSDNIGITVGGTKRVDIGASTVFTGAASTTGGFTVGNALTVTTGAISASGSTATFNSVVTNSISGSAAALVFDTVTSLQANGMPTTDDAAAAVSMSGSLTTSGLVVIPASLTSTYGAGVGMAYSGNAGGKQVFCSATGVVVRSATSGASDNVLWVETNTSGSSSFNLIQARTAVGGTPDVEFKVDGVGTVYSDGGTAMTTPADYAEMFEWADGNPGGEDRVGLTVALDGSKIRIATALDVPIGVVSGNPAVLGDAADLRWSDKYVRDDFNRPVLNDDGTRKVNPNFDPATPYVPRRQRKEWSAVGLMGKLRVRKGSSVSPRWIKMRDISVTVEEWLVI